MSGRSNTCESAADINGRSEQSAQALAGSKKKTGFAVAAIVFAVIAAVGAVLLFSGKMDRMMATARAGRGNYTGALESYERYLSRSGECSSEAYIQASLYALSAGDADKALMYARSVPEKSAESERLAGKAAIVLARNAAGNKDWETALELLENVDGEDAKALSDEVSFNLAVEAAERKEFDKAVSMLEDNSYDLSDDMLSRYRYDYGRSLMAEGRFEEAAAQFEKTDYADSDDLRGQCYFMTSVDQAFLTDLRNVCFDIIENGASAESLREAAEKLGKYSDRLFNDSELAFFGEELGNAFLGDSMTEDGSASEYCSVENECLEIINGMYPFEEEDWEEIMDFFFDRGRKDDGR